MKKFKLFTDIEESYRELIYKVSWPTKSQLASSTILVMIASIIMALVVLLMDMGIDKLMHFIYYGRF
ncbi:MAG: preprotein translocase subunit SecE [Muribaculaceae bacterium]|nr:preprotein translocase subunit SecE [Muribaculaceae bacterium]